MSLTIGSQVARYRILQKLGAGGMGEVFQAEDLSLGRKAAIKILPEQFTQDAERVRRFEQEARSASGLNHPNIITIYEIGKHEGAHFIATEYIEGETLRQRINARSFEIAHAVMFLASPYVVIAAETNPVGTTNSGYETGDPAAAGRGVKTTARLVLRGGRFHLLSLVQVGDELSAFAHHRAAVDETARAVAVGAVRPHLAAVRIGVARGAHGLRAREVERLVAGRARGRRVRRLEREAVAGVIEARAQAQRAPVRRRMAELALLLERAVRVLDTRPARRLQRLTAERRQRQRESHGHRPGPREETRPHVLHFTPPTRWRRRARGL